MFGDVNKCLTFVSTTTKNNTKKHTMTTTEKTQAIETLRTYLALDTCEMMVSYTKGRIEALKVENPKSKKLMKTTVEFASINTNDTTQAFWKGFLNILEELNK